MTVANSTVIESTPVRAGVVGVGAMGENHARVYSELQDTTLVGVTDLDTQQAERVAAEYGTQAYDFERLLENCDVVTVAVPTKAHYDVVGACIDAGVHVLVEKPIADTIERGRELKQRAHEEGVTLQVGHIERFNPAVQALSDLIDDLDVIAVEAERLGPPIDRTATDDVTYDLMIHDIDIVHSLLGREPSSIAATGAENGNFATATMEYDDGVVASITASRVTQKKIRRLTVTAEECLVEVDYLEQTVLIHRDSYPEYVIDDGKNRYRHESVIERPRVQNREPLRCELESFVETVSDGTIPEVTADDGLHALETVQTIDRLVAEEDGLEVRPQ
ncbi:Gfo/Idh/MocA family oxidoreductase [Halobacteria archaeon AArc-m2/3/4]|uniref:Gfo/Idh/MocA family oxidoreductase n=1 Tax=Natronoglomus mannanivorans TaxID=2979990 RepID=A0ABT2QGY2_9EURY|nr:Gfo/Idh/MocA family oxidoreductase [Halobacteria archaeon AArc-m2/3/4]